MRIGHYNHKSSAGEAATRRPAPILVVNPRVPGYTQSVKTRDLKPAGGRSFWARASLALPLAVFIAISLFIVIDRQRPGSTHFVDYGQMDSGPRSPINETAEQKAFDPYCGMAVNKQASGRVVYQGKTYYFCTIFCRMKFLDRPEFYQGKDVEWDERTMIGIPTWMYQIAVAVILLISFGLVERLSWRRERFGKASRGPRIDLSALPGVRAMLKSRSLISVLRAVSAALFLLMVAGCFYGSGDSEKNIVPLLVWTVWWEGLIFFVIFMGGAWCTFCPWDTIAGWMEGLSLRKRWPPGMRNMWPAILLFLSLTWFDEALNLEMGLGMTGWLAIAMVVAASAFVIVFDRKVFCRYGCFVGRLIGLYSMLAPVEVRANDDSVCASCKTMDCYKGNERGVGCPTFLFPRAFDVNINCTLCAECFKTCPHDNMVLNLRPWGSDLARELRPRMDETVLILLLLSLTGFHGLAMSPSWMMLQGGLSRTLGLSETTVFTMLMSVLIIIPIGFYAGLMLLASFANGKLAFKRLFMSYAYALLPIAMSYHLAHNAEHLLLEGPKLLPMLSDPFGWGWDLFGTAQLDPVPLITLEGLWCVQVFFILGGHMYGLFISEKVTRRLVSERGLAFRTQLPMLLAMISFSVFSLWLLKRPLLMLVSAM